MSPGRRLKPIYNSIDYPLSIDKYLPVANLANPIDDVEFEPRSKLSYQSSSSVGSNRDGVKDSYPICDRLDSRVKRHMGTSNQRSDELRLYKFTNHRHHSVPVSCVGPSATSVMVSDCTTSVPLLEQSVSIQWSVVKSSYLFRQSLLSTRSVRALDAPRRWVPRESQSAELSFAVNYPANRGK